MPLDKEEKRAWQKKWNATNRERKQAKEREWLSRNPGKHAEYSRRWREKNKDQIVEKRRQKRERKAAYDRERYAHKSDAIRENVERRRGKRIQATPSWVDRVALATGYMVAAALREAGLPVEVDHMVPLTSDHVCGLHTHDNLDIVLRPRNRAKGNWRWPDMWSPADGPA